MRNFLAFCIFTVGVAVAISSLRLAFVGANEWLAFFCLLVGAALMIFPLFHASR